MIYAVTAIHDGLPILPHFLRHYALLGVDQILIAADERLLVPVSRACAEFPANVYPFRMTVFDTMQKLRIENAVLELAAVGADDYVLYLDMDEFHEYPAPLSQIVTQMDRTNEWALRGYFLDRIARDGRLHPIEPAPSIWEQFPIGCRITRNLLHGWDQKIMLCRRRARINAGHHVTNSARCDAKPVPGTYRVHHFKWVNGVLERTRARLAESKLNSFYRKECERLLAHYKDGFNLKDRRLEAAYVGAPKSA